MDSMDNELMSEWEEGNDFPYLNSMDTEKTISTFDYSKWKNAKSSIKLLSVNWDSEYNHTVDWKSEEARNKWFHDKEGHVVEMNTEWNFKSLEVFKPGLGKHVGSIAVSIPYEEAMEFNYLSVEMWEQPVPGAGIPRREHFFYFMTSINKTAASTTDIFIELDTWTTYRNSVKVPMVNIERGHYPLSITSATDFLTNPLEKSYGLTTPEPDLPSVKSKVSHEKFVSFQKNEARVCIVTTADFSKPASFWLDARNTQHSGIKNNTSTLRGVDNWWWNVNASEGYTEGLDNGRLPVAPVANQYVDGKPGLRTYSISTADYAGFINMVRNKIPKLLESIVSIFLLDSVFIDETTAVDLFGFKFKTVRQQNSFNMIEEFKLSKSQFGFKAAYADLAKLYTKQFSQIEISNLNGTSTLIAVEEVFKNLEVYSRSSSGFPFLKLEAFINGVGGDAKKSYAVKPWNAKNAELFQSDWESFKFDIEIPTFGIFASADEANLSENLVRKFDIKQKTYEKSRLDLARNELDQDLKNTSIDLTKRNTDSGISKSYNNAKDSVKNEYLTTLSVTARKLVNDLAIVANTKKTSLASIKTTGDNTAASIATNYTNERRNIILDKDNATLEIQNNYHNRILSIDMKAANDSNMAGVPLEIHDEVFGNEYDNLNAMATISLVNANSSILAMGNKTGLGVLSGGYSAVNSSMTSIASGSPLGAASSIAGFGIGAFTQVEAMEIEVKLMTFQHLLLNDVGRSMDITFEGLEGNAVSYIGPTRAQQELDYREINSAFNASIPYHATLEVIDKETEVNKIINSNDQIISNAVRDETYDIKTENNSSTNSTDSDNNIRTRNTDNSNVYLNEGVGINTAYYENYTSIEVAENTEATNRTIYNRIKTLDDIVAKDIVVTDKSIASKERNMKDRFTNLDYEIAGEYERDAGIFSQFSGKPEKYGDESGDAALSTWGQLGIDIKIKRVSTGDEEIIGKTFLRYGYRTENLIIDDPELSVMTGFTYWKAREAWVYGDNINETNKNIIRHIFTRGTTIWDNPDNVLRVKAINNKVK